MVSCSDKVWLKIVDIKLFRVLRLFIVGIITDYMVSQSFERMSDVGLR